MRRVRIWARLVIDKDVGLTLIVEGGGSRVAITCEGTQQGLNEYTFCQVQEYLVNHRHAEIR